MAQKEKQLLFKNLYGKLPYGMVTVQEKITRIMTTEEKQLLLVDLCARLPYGVKFQGEDSNIYTLDAANYFALQVEDMIFKPYLRPMGSITEKEKEEIKPLFSEFTDEFGKRVLVVRQNKMALYQDWLNAHHFDYRGLIEKGLALEAKEEIYKIE